MVYQMKVSGIEIESSVKKIKQQIEVSYEIRQVIDIEYKCVATEY